MTSALLHILSTRKCNVSQRSEKAGFRKTWANPKTSSWKHSELSLYLTRCTQTLVGALQIPLLCNLCFFPEVECKLLHLLFYPLLWFLTDILLLWLFLQVWQFDLQ